MSRKRPSRARAKIRTTLREFRMGRLRSGSGKVVTSRKQAVAIALSKARKAGARIPKKRRRRKGG